MSISIQERYHRWLAAVGRHRKFLVRCVLLGVAASGIFVLLRPPTFVAEAGVAILHTRLQTTFEVSSSAANPEEVQAALMAAPESALQGNAQLAASYLATRRQTLVALVENESIAEVVLKLLGADARPEEREPGALLSRVHGTIKPGENGDREFTNIIRVSVEGDDPQRAALLANLWAMEYVNLVNRRLGQCADLPALRQAQEAAQGELDRAERDLTSFLSESRLEELGRRRAEVLSTLEALGRARESEVATAGQNQDVQALIAALDRQFAPESPLSSAIAAQEARARELATAVEGEEARLRRLTTARNRAQEALAAVAKRLGGLPSESELAGEEVRVVAKAAVPSEPVPPMPWQTVALGALAGLLLGLAPATFFDGQRPTAGPAQGPVGAAEQPAASPTPSATAAV